MTSRQYPDRPLTKLQRVLLDALKEYGKPATISELLEARLLAKPLRVWTSKLTGTVHQSMLVEQMSVLTLSQSMAHMERAGCVESWKPRRSEPMIWEFIGDYD